MSEPRPQKRWTPTGILVGLIGVAWLICPVSTPRGLIWFVALTVTLFSRRLSLSLRTGTLTTSEFTPSPAVEHLLPLQNISISSCGGTTSNCSYVQSRGALSIRHRRNCAMCRNRSPCICSYATSTTSSGRTASHDRSFPADHRLCPPGILPLTTFSAHPAHGWPFNASTRYGSNKETSSFRFGIVKLAHTPTCCSAPAAS